MKTALALNGGTTATTNYLTWSPSPCEVRLVENGGAGGPVTVRLRNQRTDVGGQVVFYAQLPGEPADELEIDLPADGGAVEIYVGGKYPHASIADGDAAIEMVQSASGAVLSVTPLMVRIRKDANLLTPGERLRFLEALGKLNNKGQGRFNELRDMHRASVEDEAHGHPGFLPWHRAYMMDFERELQAIDASVALPYWRFERPAPNLFHRDFMGEPDGTGTPRFSLTNPLQYWKTDNGARIVREPYFRPNEAPQLADEVQTMAYGDEFELFRQLEGDPHGYAHTSFDGDLGAPDTAPMDPLFFLLHNNIDRLWAKWQYQEKRWDASDLRSYPYPGGASGPKWPRIGHNLSDTMWPWNGATAAPRPNDAPGGALASSPVVAAPGPSPRVGDMIDYQGRLNPAHRLGFDYDDVRF